MHIWVAAGTPALALWLHVCIEICICICMCIWLYICSANLDGRGCPGTGNVFAYTYPHIHLSVMLIWGAAATPALALHIHISLMRVWEAGGYSSAGTLLTCTDPHMYICTCMIIETYICSANLGGRGYSGAGHV